MLKTCPSLQPGAVGYDSCMATVDKSATEQIISEVEEVDDNGGTSFRSAFIASPAIVNGKPQRMQYAEEQKNLGIFGIFLSGEDKLQLNINKLR